MKRLLAVTLSASVLVVSACAQSRQTRPGVGTPQTGESAAPVTVDQIIDRYVKAIGGADAIRRITTQVMKGTFEFPEQGIKGAIETYAKAPNKFVVSMRTPDDSLFTITGFNGTVGWQRMLLQAEERIDLRDMRGAELTETKLSAEFHKSIKLRELYPKMTLKGVQKVDDRDAYAIEAVPVAGNPETMYFDTQTALLIRRDNLSPGSQGEKIRRETYYDDYRMVNGCQIVHTASIIYPDRPDLNLILRFSEVLVNAPLPDPPFDRPKK